MIIVYDVTSHASFLNVRQWLSEVDDGTDEGAIVMLLGNKVDVPREADDPNMNIVTSKTGAQLAEVRAKPKPKVKVKPKPKPKVKLFLRKKFRRVPALLK